MGSDAASFDGSWFVRIIVLYVVEVVNQLVNDFHDRADYLVSILLDLAVADAIERYLFDLLGDQVASLIKEAGSACVGALIDCKIIVQCFMLELYILDIIRKDSKAFAN